MSKKPPYLPFNNGQWRLAMGLKPLPIKNWIEIDDDLVQQLTLKTELLTRRYSEVFASLKGSQAGQQEVLELLLQHLLHYFPNFYQQQGNQILNRLTGQVWHLTDFEANPLDLAGRLVQEDFCLMLPGENGYELKAASLCFPLRWKLREKLGLPMSQIHQHVPDYANKLERPVDRVFNRLRSNYPGYRLNWTIIDSPELFLEQSKHREELDSTITPDNAGERLWLRVERQTIRRLEKSGGIIFTVRTYVHPLYTLADDPHVIRNLANAIQQIPTAMQVYKNLPPIRTALLTYLDRLVANSTVSV